MQLHFENLVALWASLFLIPFVLLLVWRAKKYGQRVFPKTYLLSLGLFAAVIGIARPQLGRTTSHSQAKKGQVFIAFDISRSMLVQDMGTNRVEFAIAFVRRLLERLGTTKVALYPFAADGYLQLPLTTDLESASDMVSALTPTMTTHQGTDLTKVLQNLFAEIQRQEQKATLAGTEWAATQVVLVSDGESHVPLKKDVLGQYRSRRIPIFAVGVGTVGGGQVPPSGRFVNTPDFVKDPAQQPAVSKFSPETMKSVADLSGGAYFAPRFEETERLAHRLSQSIAFGRLSTTFKVERELYPWLFLIAFVFFLTQLSLNRWEYAIRLLPFVLFAAPSFAGNENNRAIETYNDALKKLDKDPAAAARLFQESAMLATDPAVKKKAFYNLGNTYLRGGDPQQAMQAYQQAYDARIDDKKATETANRRISENLLLAAKQLEQMKSSQQGNKSPGEGQSSRGQTEEDRKRAQTEYEMQSFSPTEKQRIYDAISSEEQQVLQRLEQARNGKNPQTYSGKPW